MTHIRYRDSYLPHSKVEDIQAACYYTNACGENEGIAEEAQSIGRNAEALLSRLVELLVIKKILTKDDLTYLLRKEVEEIIGVDGPIA